MLSHRVLSVTAEVRHRVLPLKCTEGRGFARKYAVEGRAGEAEDKAEGAARGRRGWRQPPLHHGAVRTLLLAGCSVNTWSPAMHASERQERGHKHDSRGQRLRSALTVKGDYLMRCIHLPA